MPARLLSLDMFRGLVMAFMVLVNMPGTEDHVYPQLRHARWDGWTATDVVFPSFVWIVGVALSFRKPDVGRVWRRSVILFALGLFVYLYPEFDFAHMRILGVLQRIAICYLLTAGIVRWMDARGQIVMAVVLLGLYTGLMMLAPVPGYGAGRLDVEGNFAHYVDRILLGPHNYANTKTWDPEGVVSTITAVVTCLLGVFAGYLLRHPQRFARYVVLGVGLMATGVIWSYWMPVNKALWSPSFVLLMAGIDCLVLNLVIWLVDEKGWQGWARPFEILGKNAIAVYMAHELIDITLRAIPYGGGNLREWVFLAWFAPWAAPVNASLWYALANVALNWAIAWGLWRRGWFLRA